MSAVVNEGAILLSDALAQIWTEALTKLAKKYGVLVHRATVAISQPGSPNSLLCYLAGRSMRCCRPISSTIAEGTPALAANSGQRRSAARTCSMS